MRKFDKAVFERDVFLEFVRISGLPIDGAAIEYDCGDSEDVHRRSASSEDDVNPSPLTGEGQGRG